MNFYIIKLTLSACIIGLIGCTHGTRNNSRPTSDEVVSRIDDLNSRPDWLKESEPFVIRNGEVLSLGYIVIPGDDRVSAGFRISENNAKSGLSSGIESKLEFIFQNAEEGSKIGQEQVRFIGSEVTSLTSSSIRPKFRYWEKVRSTLDTGEQVTRYKIYSLVAMPEQEFKKAILRAIEKQEGKNGISVSFSEKVDAQWENITSSVKEKSE